MKHHCLYHGSNKDFKTFNTKVSHFYTNKNDAILKAKEKQSNCIAKNNDAILYTLKNSNLNLLDTHNNKHLKLLSNIIPINFRNSYRQDKTEVIKQLSGYKEIKVNANNLVRGKNIGDFFIKKVEDCDILFYVVNKNDTHTTLIKVLSFYEIDHSEYNGSCNLTKDFIKKYKRVKYLKNITEKYKCTCDNKTSLFYNFIIDILINNNVKKYSYIKNEIIEDINNNIESYQIPYYREQVNSIEDEYIDDSNYINYSNICLLKLPNKNKIYKESYNNKIIYEYILDTINQNDFIDILYDNGFDGIITYYLDFHNISVKKIISIYRHAYKKIDKINKIKINNV